MSSEQNTPERSRKMPLVLNINGQRNVIGEAHVRPDGKGTFLITNAELRTSLGIADGSFSFSLGESNVPEDAAIDIPVSPYVAERLKYWLTPKMSRPAWGSQTL